MVGLIEEGECGLRTLQVHAKMITDDSPDFDTRLEHVDKIIF